MISMWALVATLGVFKTAQLQLSPSGTGLRGAAASFRRRATIASDHESRVQFEGETARRATAATAAGGFAVVELTQAVYPRAHTCFNRIDVPLYRTKEELVASFEFVLELGDQTFTMD